MKKDILTTFVNMKNRLWEDIQVKCAEVSALVELHQEGSVSDKIAVFENFEGLDLDGYLSLHGIVLVLVERGSCELEINLNRVHLSEGCAYMCFTGQVTRMISMSADFKPLCVACSQNMVEDLMLHMKDSFRLMLMVKQVPYARWEPEKFAQLKKSFEYLQSKIKQAKDNQFYYQIVKNSLLTLSFECFGYMMEKMTIPKGSNRKDTLFNSFIRNVEKNHKKEHSVKFYADELFVTPKYLSAVCDDLSGKGAKQWIDEYVALTAKMMLRSSQKDVQEISKELNFPDMSFFGKFFKRMVGMSPKAYRNKRD